MNTVVRRLIRRLIPDAAIRALEELFEPAGDDQLHLPAAAGTSSTTTDQNTES